MSLSERVYPVTSLQAVFFCTTCSPSCPVGDSDLPLPLNLPRRARVSQRLSSQLVLPTLELSDIRKPSNVILHNEQRAVSVLRRVPLLLSSLECSLYKLDYSEDSYAMTSRPSRDAISMCTEALVKL